MPKHAIYLFLIVIFAATLNACGGKGKSDTTSTSAPAEPTRSSGADESRIMTRRIPGDPALTKAGEEARKTFPTFAQAFTAAQEKSDKNAAFSVKAPISDANNIEHIWIDVSGVKGDQIEGFYQTDGSVVTAVHEGDAARAKVSEIEDWMITEGKTKKGGYSVMVLMNRAIAQNNNITTSSKEKDLAALVVHWKKVSPSHGKKPQEAITTQDIKTMAMVDLIERLNEGNTGQPASVQELADICGLPADVIQAIRDVKTYH